jgi:lipid-binding SYLF domain-containing protein
MKTTATSLHSTLRAVRPAILLALTAALVASPLARAADAPASPPATKDTLVKQVANDAAFYQSLQFDPSTIVPNWVVAHAKGVLILDGSSAPNHDGQAIGLIKGADKKFSAPAFYALGHSADGLQKAPAGVQVVAFLMSDKAIRSLTGNQITLTGLHAVTGDPNATAVPAGAMPDIIVFQEASNLDPAKLLAVTTLSVNNPNNAVFYEQSGLTAADIYSGKVDVPTAAAPLVDTFNQQAAMPN